jgi:hypothetical protein
VDPDKAYLTGDGPVCDACHSQGEIDVAFVAAAKYYPSTSLALALVSFVFNPLFGFTIASIVVAITGVSKLTRGETAQDYARALGLNRSLYIMGCVAAILLAIGRIALRLGMGALQ